MATSRAKYREYVTFRLERVSSVARAEASELYQRQCGLDIRELRVLRRVAEAPKAIVSDIVDATMFERTLVSRIISQLVSAKLLSRTISDTDARQFKIDITKLGLQKVAVADDLGDRLNDELLSSLTAIERKVFDRCLEKLVQWRPKEQKLGVAAKRSGIAAEAPTGRRMSNGGESAGYSLVRRRKDDHQRSQRKC